MIDSKRIQQDILDLPVQGVNLVPGTFSEQFSDQPTLLVFLRHFG